MSKTKETSAQASGAVTKAGCCCGNHEKDHELQPGSKEPKPLDTAHTAPSHTQSDAGCCDGTKARK